MNIRRLQRRIVALLFGEVRDLTFRRSSGDPGRQIACTASPVPENERPPFGSVVEGVALRRLPPPCPTGLS
jgi:hypothetical protein